MDDTQTRYIRNIQIMEVKAPKGMSDEDVIEAWDLGEIEGYEVDGRVEIKPA